VAHPGTWSKKLPFYHPGRIELLRCKLSNKHDSLCDFEESKYGDKKTEPDR
jgi:hypothetical protein